MFSIYFLFVSELQKINDKIYCFGCLAIIAQYIKFKDDQMSELHVLAFVRPFASCENNDTRERPGSAVGRSCKTVLQQPVFQFNESRERSHAHLNSQPRENVGCRRQPSELADQASRLPDLHGVNKRFALRRAPARRPVVLSL